MAYYNTTVFDVNATVPTRVDDVITTNTITDVTPSTDVNISSANGSIKATSISFDAIDGGGGALENTLTITNTDAGGEEFTVNYDLVYEGSAAVIKFSTGKSYELTLTNASDPSISLDSDSIFSTHSTAESQRKHYLGYV